MKRDFSLVKKEVQTFLLRQLQIVFIILCTFFTFLTFVFAGALPAHAQVMTPEEYSDFQYRNNMQHVNSDKLTFKQQDKQQENPLEKVADNVREKLNLDEELPRSTKEFLGEVQEDVEKTVEPVTQTEHGYYQDNAPVKQGL